MMWWTEYGWFGWAAMVAAVILGLAAILTVVRIVRGPSLLDRIIASDVLLVIISCGLLIWMAVSSDFSSLPMVFLASVIGFLGSVTVARVTASSAATQMPVEGTGPDAAGDATPGAAQAPAAQAPAERGDSA
ncbi:monovalent cation/H+ antiporter complex subunit F [Pseudoglutamicibacter albus]|uniref:monovalent cation/H+ antiporter complex subunit F n=1 Tax=Pseudoglutamicibacter albus TaxID=98671 RepID=UPI000AA2FF1A